MNCHWAWLRTSSWHEADWWDTVDHSLFSSIFWDPLVLGHCWSRDPGGLKPPRLLRVTPKPPTIRVSSAHSSVWPSVQVEAMTAG